MLRMNTKYYKMNFCKNTNNHLGSMVKFTIINNLVEILYIINKQIISKTQVLDTVKASESFKKRKTAI